MKIELGDRVKDKITGLKGIVVARTEWLYGCMRFTIQPESSSKDGKLPDTATFDEPQLEMIKKNVLVNPNVAAAPAYGPRDDHAALRRD